MVEEIVLEKVCNEKHKAIDDKQKSTETRLNDYSARIDSVEDAVIKLTNMVEALSKKSIFDKITVSTIFVISMVLLAIVLGPEITGKIVGGIKP